MKKLLLLTFCCCLGLAKSQTITYNGCHNLFDDQDFIFNKTGVDTFGKGIYITSPVDGEQGCGGLGFCEFKISWNNDNKRWEFIADANDGEFTSTYLIYYNSEGSSTATNPPNHVTGTWIENTSITGSQCGGNMDATNSKMDGDVHTSTLSLSDQQLSTYKIYPNPVKDILNIVGLDQPKTISIFDINGRLVITEKSKSSINVVQLQKGVYILRIETKDSKSHDIKFIKK